MHRTALDSSGLSGARPSLREAISSLHLDFAHMRDELRDANLEIGSLKRKLRSRPPQGIPEMPETNVGSLRRQVSFYCHPDRGGDEALMQRLNKLFDYLAHLQLATQPVEALARS